MVWVAISNRGISKTLFRPLLFVAVNWDIYTNKCLEKWLLPFIRKHHPGSNDIFWLDLPGCNHSKQTLAWMDENVKFVLIEINPPNVPQARPIENF